jgi:hypothetical protein
VQTNETAISIVTENHLKQTINFENVDFPVSMFMVDGGVDIKLHDLPPRMDLFLSITRVPVVQIEQMRAHLKGISARIVMNTESMVTCASGLLPNPAKVQYFQYKA